MNRSAFLVSLVMLSALSLNTRLSVAFPKSRVAKQGNYWEGFHNYF